MTYPTYTRQFFIEGDQTWCLVKYGDELLVTGKHKTRSAANDEATRLIIYHQRSRGTHEDPENVPF